MADTMRVGFLITGRLKSTRLPKKLLLSIKGKAVISHMIDRLKLAQRVDEIIICTSTHEQDRPLQEIARENGVQCFCGDPDDVLARLLAAADAYALDYVLNITADCPFVDPIYADQIVEKYLETDADLIRQFDLPHGVFSYGIKVAALRRAVEIKASNDTEVWGRYFTDTGLFDVLDLDVVEPSHHRPGMRMTLDYPEDFRFFEAVFDALYRNGEVFSLTEILAFLDAHPEVVEINRDCGAKFRKRFLAQSEPMLKRGRPVSSALVIGAGSIGQRHIRNLRELGITQITALRSRKGHFKALPAELGVVEVERWEDALACAPDVALVANPTSLHVDAALRLVPHVRGLFIEKPLSHTLDGCQPLVESLRQKQVVSFVGHNLMLHPIVEQLQLFADQHDMGEVVSVQCQVGQWLPDWHPYEDFRQAYYARKDLGGGVTLTLVHEIHLALELGGLPCQVQGWVARDGQLEVEVETRADVIIRHKTGAVSQVHLDYLQRPAHRSGTVSFERGWASYDFTLGQLVGQCTDDAQPRMLWSDGDYDGNQMYLDQMARFIRYVEEGRVKHRFDAAFSLESLKVVEALLASDRLGQAVDIERNERFSF